MLSLRNFKQLFRYVEEKREIHNPNQKQNVIKSETAKFAGNMSENVEYGEKQNKSEFVKFS